MSNALRTLLTLAAVAAPVPAAIWIVDTNGGAGSHFKTITAAVAAAADGDVIVVRPGTYTEAVTTSKALSLVSGGGALWAMTSNNASALVVTGLGAGKSFALVGFTIGIEPGGTVPAIDVNSCAGAVMFNDVTSGFRSAGLSPAVIRSRSSRALGLNRCVLTGAPALEVQGSSAVVTDSSLRGVSPQIIFTTLFPGHPALVATSSKVVLSQDQMFGANGTFYGTNTAPSQPAVAMFAADVVVTGATGTRLVAGNFRADAVSALQGDATSTVVLDPRAVIVSSGNAPPISIGVVITTRRTPFLSVTPASVGGMVRLDLSSAAGENVVSFVGLPAAPIPLAALGGHVWIDPGLLIRVGAAVQGANEHWVHSIGVPNDPTLRGFSLAWQGMSSGGAGTLLSTPAFVAIQ